MACSFKGMNIKIITVILLSLIITSCGGYKLRLVNPEWEEKVDEDIKTIRQGEGEQLSDINVLKNNINDVKVKVSVLEKKLASLEGKIGTLSTGTDENKVAIGVIQNKIEDDERKKIERDISVSDQTRDMLKLKTAIKEYEVEAVSLRSDYIELKDALDKLSSKTGEAGGQAEENSETEKMVIEKYNELSKTVAGFSNLLESFGSKIEERIDKQDEKLSEIERIISDTGSGSGKSGKKTGTKGIRQERAQ